MLKKGPRFFKTIRPILFKWMFCACLFAACIFVYLGHPYNIFSMGLGLTFSYFILRTLFYQAISLQTMSLKKSLFKNYLKRLFFYGAPTILALKFPNYFNLPIILISLFGFQISYIILEILIAVKKIKRKKKKWNTLATSPKQQ